MCFGGNADFFFLTTFLEGSELLSPLLIFIWPFVGILEVSVSFQSVHFCVSRRILASCTELMQTIKELILSSKHLQREIVESGRVSLKAVSPPFNQPSSQSSTGLHRFKYFIHPRDQI